MTGPLAIVRHLNAAHGTRFQLRGRCADGLQGGAWMLADAAGRPAVLKTRPTGDHDIDGDIDRDIDGDTDRDIDRDIGRVAAAVARVRAAGYPTPAWLASGTGPSGISYWVQDFVPGRPSTPLTPSTAERLVEVLERQAGLDPFPDAGAEPSESDDGARHAVLDLGPAGASLVAAFDRLLSAAGPVPVTGRDMVHGDFNSCNILLDDGSGIDGGGAIDGGGGVAGVIDVQDLASGSRAVDYACLLREAYVEDYGDDVIRIVRRAGEAVAGWPTLVTCVAAAAYFIVGFKLRHEPPVVPTTLARLHRLADDLARPTGL